MAHLFSKTPSQKQPKLLWTTEHSHRLPPNLPSLPPPPGLTCSPWARSPSPSQPISPAGISSDKNLRKAHPVLASASSQTHGAAGNARVRRGAALARPQTQRDCLGWDGGPVPTHVALCCRSVSDLSACLHDQLPEVGRIGQRALCSCCLFQDRKAVHGGSKVLDPQL